MKDRTVRKLFRAFNIATYCFGVLTLVAGYLGMHTLPSSIQNGQATLANAGLILGICLAPLALAWACHKARDHFAGRIHWTREEIEEAEVRRFGDLNAP